MRKNHGSRSNKMRCPMCRRKRQILVTVVGLMCAECAEIVASADLSERTPPATREPVL